MASGAVNQEDIYSRLRLSQCGSGCGPNPVIFFYKSGQNRAPAILWMDFGFVPNREKFRFSVT